MGKFQDLTGFKFGELTVLNRADDYISPSGKKVTRWNCLCDCENTTLVLSSTLKSGKTTSCGCYLKKIRGKSNIKHNSFTVDGDIAVVEVCNGKTFTIDKEDIVIVNNYCWNISNQGYVVAKERNGRKSKTILLHRLIMSCTNEKMVVDHIDHNPLNNRKINLRICTQSQNMMNSIVPADNKTRVKGVGWDKSKGKWIASIGVNGRNIFLGRYDTMHDAIIARKSGEKKYYGQYSCEHGIPYILAIDTGTSKSGYCILNKDTYGLLEFGKIDNKKLIEIIADANSANTTVVFERFAPQNVIGKTTIDSIIWYGKYVRECETHKLKYEEIYRREVKKHFLGKIDKSKGSADSQIRRALIDRFAKFDFKNGKGTKVNPDYFYGVSTTDVYAAIAVGVMWIDISSNNSTNISGT